jgi:GT2 family glycosyltransferase
MTAMSENCIDTQQKPQASVLSTFSFTGSSIRPILADQTSYEEIGLHPSPSETVFYNARHASATPVLSVASPYYRDDPTGWLRAMAKDANAHLVEAVVVDDGTGDVALDARVRAAIEDWPGPAAAVRLHQNQGRSAARNRGIKESRGQYVLFVDADMLPGDDQFLSRYLSLIERKAAAVAFGGFTTHGVAVSHDTSLHQNLSERSDCKPASERSARGPIAVASNNLLVRKDVFEAEPFDNRFTGWGWEDTEWAVRVVKAGYGLIHTENPAVHVGLDTTEAMLKKYREAGPNLARLIAMHPHTQRMAGVQVANLLARLPGHTLLRGLAANVARDERQLFPMTLRRMAIKYWRASWAASALRAQRN